MQLTEDDVARHFPLVRLVVGRMLRQGQLWEHHELDDLEAVGRWAVCEALRRWDPDKGAQSSYLVPYIRGYLLHYQRDVSRPHGWHRDLGQVARVVSLDAPVNETGRTLLDVVAEEEAPVDDAETMFSRLLQVSARLTGRQRVVAEHLLADEPLAAAAKRLGVSHTIAGRIAKQVRQEFAEALA